MKQIPEFAKREVASRLRELASRELQEQGWLHGKSGGLASPEELICQLFDDTALDHYLGRRQGKTVFSSTVDALLIKISALLDEIDLSVPPRVLLRVPQWLEVRDLAAEAAALIEALPAESPRRG